MTVHTAQIGMPPFQRKLCSLMIKAHHAVVPIMATETVLPEFLDVAEHKGRIMPGVAGSTLPLWSGKASLGRMAGQALDRRGIVIDLVPDQAEGRG